MSEIIGKRNIKTLTELQALAFHQKEEKKQISLSFSYTVTRTPRAVMDILNSAWEIEGAQENLNCEMKSRMDILREAREWECVDGCNGEWLSCAREILHNNGVPMGVFSEAVTDLLTKGRGKYRNIMIVGTANCGKTFVLNPLTEMYHTFCNPTSGSFAWIGVESGECIFLNDFRWPPQLIPWHDLLLLLKGHVVHVAAPKTHFAKDITFTADTPIFCTRKHPLLYIKNGVVDECQTEMMTVRWQIFHFNYQIPRERQREIPLCSRCLSELIIG